MSVLINIKDIRLEYPAKRVLNGVTLGVNSGERIGIVGRNGDGKSSLLGILGGSIQADNGVATRSSGLNIGILGQDDTPDLSLSVGEFLFGGKQEHEWASDKRVREILNKLIDGIDWQQELGKLSGGERRRVQLAALLIEDWDLLMLDEPTNHLDLNAINWLTSHLKGRWAQGDGALLVVTHDRWFLDEVCTRMWEVYDGKVRAFEGGYSAYMLERVQRQQANAKAEQRRRNIARKELAWLSRGARARSTKPKFHVKLARELIANEPPLRDSIELKRASVARLGKQVVDLLGASLCYPGKIVLEPCDWSIGAGERIGILGANGSGKTSLLKLIDASLAPSSGTVKIGASVRFGTMTQEQHELKPYADSQVLELLAECKGSYLVDGKELTPAKLLENLGFERKHLLSRVADLSGGLRRRLQLLLTLLAMPNFLILDEPGNDLDTDMLAVTESLLDSWPGTLILVSHDRYLLERVTDMQYAIIDGKLRHLPAGVEQYLQLTADTPPMQATRQESTKQTTGKATGQESTATGGHKKGDKKSEATKSKQVNSYQLAKDLASTERKLDTLAKKQTALIEQMHETNPSDYLELVRLGEAQEQLKREINSLEEHWYQLNEQL